MRPLLILLLLTLGACRVETSAPAVEPEAASAPARPSTDDTTATPRSPVRQSVPEPRPAPPDTSLQADSTAAPRSRRPVSAEARRTSALDALDDLADRAGSADAQGLARALDAAAQAAAGLDPASPPVDSLLRRARAAARRDDRDGVALAAARAARALTDDRPVGDADRLRGDARVLAATVRPALPDWTAVRRAVDAVEGGWGRQSLGPLDAGRRDALGAAVAAARSGLDTRNAAVVALAAEVVADLASRSRSAALHD